MLYSPPLSKVGFKTKLRNTAEEMDAYYPRSSIFRDNKDQWLLQWMHQIA